MHQNRSISLFAAPFDHIQFLPTLKQKCVPDLRLRLIIICALSGGALDQDSQAALQVLVRKAGGGWDEA